MNLGVLGLSKKKPLEMLSQLGEVSYQGASTNSIVLGCNTVIRMNLGAIPFFVCILISCTILNIRRVGIVHNVKIRVESMIQQCPHDKIVISSTGARCEHHRV
jgi:hypothetical protein